ncbi:MAG: polyphosphate kinase 2 family protein [Candidatus Latescibacteria bacterium]|nr:polyphosphate kinase 2 family protein [Candidatus Latescibacterota bacterium]
MATVKTRSLARRHRVVDGARFRLAGEDPADTGPIATKERAQKLLARGIQRLRDAQERLYAQDNWAVLLIFQAMDAAGKDGAIEHVMSGVNPQGCQVFSFKAPSDEELDHDFMWRTSKNLPERGRVGIFNRSYYEEVLVVRVHPEILQRQKLPPKLVARNVWKQRFEDIVAFERYLARNGVVVLKFFLNVSKEEQQRRFLSRIDEPAKQWKFSGADVRERAFWDDYMHAYEDMIRHTSSAHAPWYVVPADNKWYTRLVVATAVIDALDELHLAFPRVGAEKKRELGEAKRALEKEALRGPKRRRGRA